MSVYPVGIQAMAFITTFDNGRNEGRLALIVPIYCILIVFGCSIWDNRSDEKELSI